MKLSKEAINKLKELHNSGLISKRELLIYLITQITGWKELSNKSSEIESLLETCEQLEISFIKEALEEGLLDEKNIYKGIFKFIKPQNIKTVVSKVEKLLSHITTVEEEVILLGEKARIKRYIPEVLREFYIDDVFEILDASDTFTEYFIGFESPKRSNPAILISVFPIEPGRAEFLVIKPTEEKLIEVFRNCKSDFLVRLYEKLRVKYRFNSKILDQMIEESGNINTESFAKEILKLNVYYVVEEDRRFEEIINKSPGTVITLLRRLLETFDPLMTSIYLAAAIRVPRSKELLGHNVVFINFDKSNVGKTVLARILGSEPYYKATVASLLGFSSGKNIKYSILQNRNDLVVIDELGVEKDTELYGRILELLKNGVATVASGATLLKTRTWSSIIFNANVNKMLSSISEKEKARALYSYLVKITDNMQGLASRISALNFYQFSMPATKIEKDIIDSIRLLAPSLFTILGKKYEQLYKKYQDLLEEQWTKENLKKLKDITEKIDIVEVKEFAQGLSENYFKMNILALRMSLIDAYLEEKISKLEDDRKYLESLFFDNKKELEKLTLTSLNILAENLEKQEIILEKIQKLSDEGKTLLRIIAEFFKYIPTDEKEYSFDYIYNVFEEKGIDIRQYTDRTINTLAQRVIRSKKSKAIFAEFGIIFSKNGFYITSAKILNNTISVVNSNKI